MIKIAVLGSCVSRDSFHSKIISDYKNYYSCVLHQNQMSMISLAAKPISFDNKLIDNLSPFDTKHFRTELDKSFFKEMRKNQPNYLIIDFYGDLYYGIQEIGGSYITNKKWLWQRTSLYGRLEKRDAFQIFGRNQERFYPLWKEGVKTLFSFLEKELPNCKVIVNKARFIDVYLDKNDGQLKSLSESKKINYLNVDVYNKWWDVLDKHLINNYNVKTLEYDMSKYYAVEDHIWGLLYVHYNTEFYQDFTRKLLGIILNDTLDENSKLKVLIENKIG
ncbi:DUF6270 domain-containing protein [Virgibacillus soli]|uniref:DUF6270 domain-containing protein n=1 Tax=Paracerasibacillus soli TaxID=480284 RepID=A0ABU5CSK3_9BACI|nr:DUF6270 domain-containing protein [Virgibacillus soli]MDY0409350.1 DUF6270 domain-containing protein [Virgibacillus soli]